jgi:CheY-like chemotaxis protein
LRHYLLVDDNVPFADNLAEILRDDGAEVTVASDGQQALELVNSRRFDAVVTDMRMPLMDGARVVHGVRRLDPGLPAMVVTAWTSDEDLANARREGLLAILPKPVPLSRLVALLGCARRQGLVVIVEDDDALGDNLTEVLRDRGYSAVLARSVVETERLGPVAPFAALVDLRIPGGPTGDGMRKLGARFPGLPMIVITAFAGEPVPEGAEGLFLKPFQTAALLDCVDRLYAARRSDGLHD